MYYKMDEDFLAHYGVLGMKWGRRKARPSSGGTKQLSARKQQKIKEKQNYKIVKNRLEEKGQYGTYNLLNYETGEISRRKVKKYLGKDITVSQVKDYNKRLNKKGQKIAAAYTGVMLGAIATYFLKR